MMFVLKLWSMALGRLLYIRHQMPFLFVNVRASAFYSMHREYCLNERIHTESNSELLIKKR